MDDFYKDQRFIGWLHKMTILGYDKEISISSEHKEIVQGYYSAGYTPEDALEQYIAFIENS